MFAERPLISVSQNVAPVQIQGKGGERLTNQQRGHGPQSQSKSSVHVISAWVQRPCARGVWMVLLVVYSLSCQCLPRAFVHIASQRTPSLEVE